MTLCLSNRSESLSKSNIRNMSIECDRVGGINLSQGICDLEVPLSVSAGAKAAIDSGRNHYTRHDGIAELRDSIAVKLLKYNKIETDPEKNIVVSCGATGAFFCACMALLDPGDEVIIFEPFYGYHINTLLAVDITIKYARLNPPDWTFDIAELEKLITPKTKGIIINTPANPSGKVFTFDELKELGEFCITHDLFAFTDEIYEYFVYDDRHHISPAAIPGMEDRTITISGYSKVFSITGWRIGYCACHEKWAETIGLINDLIYVCAPSPLQVGTAKGINTLSEDYYRSLCDNYSLKRDKICAVLNQIEITPFVPQGAYYVIANASSLPGTGKKKAMHLLQKTGVATVPGNAFYAGSGGKDLLRFCFAKSDAELHEACEKLIQIKAVF